MTYSIVARDAVTGQLGVAAQSCYFALGAVLTWARAGVGAVATQSMVDPGYGPRCLDLLADGSGAADALGAAYGRPMKGASYARSALSAHPARWRPSRAPSASTMSGMPWATATRPRPT